MHSKFRNAGQACIASNRILVQAGVYDQFASMVANAAKQLQCSSGLQHSFPPTSSAPAAGMIGPLIDSRALNKVAITYIIYMYCHYN